jgi:hypothetical protein
MKTEDLYYHNIAKDCSNCFFRNKSFFTLSKCNLHPSWLTEDALKYCKYKEWKPNQKLYDRFEKDKCK